MAQRVEIDRRVMSFTVRQACRAAETGEWGVPEFQREFTWPPKRVASLADTLVGGHSMGVWHLWRPARRSGEVRHRNDVVEGESEYWILDGQQRLTAVCLLHGTQPLWLADDEWEALRESAPVAIDLRALRRGQNKVVLRAVGAGDSTVFLDFPALFGSAKDLQDQLGERGAGDLYGAARDLASRVNEYTIPVIALMDTPQALVIQQFQRLNTGQTKVRSSEIRQGLVSVQVPGFTVDRAAPLRAELAEAGWPVRQAVVFDAFVAVTDAKSVAAIDAPTVASTWPAYRESWHRTLDYLARRGIHDLSFWPAERLLSTLVVATHRWPAALRDDRLMQWAACALWDGHQQRGGALQRDQGLLNAAWRAKVNWTTAIARLCEQLARHAQPVRVTDLTDMRTNPAASGRRERMLYALTFPEPPTIGRRGDWATWVPLGERDSGGLADFVLVKTPDGERVGVDQLTNRQVAAQAAELPHVTRRRAEALAAALNQTLDRFGEGCRPTR